MKTNYKQMIGSSLLGLGISLVSGAFSPTIALPELQLDLLGGSYNTDEQSVMINMTRFNGQIIDDDGQFTLYTYCLISQNNCFKTQTSSPSDYYNYYLSVAIMNNENPVQNAAADFGSFTINGVTYSNLNNSSPFTLGTPPTTTSNDLATHGNYPTLYTDIKFAFDPSEKRNSVNVQDTPGTSLSLGDQALAYQDFNFDISGLKSGFDLHFDLYRTQTTSDTTTSCTGKGSKKICTNITTTSLTFSDRDKAPFSHDASFNVYEIPEPSTSLGLGLFALGGLRFLHKKNKRSASIN
jgi:hypothetical protein